MCMLLNDSPFIHLLGLSERRLSARFSDESVSIPHYTIIRRDAADQGHTGMALYIHQSIKTFTKGRNDLESEKVECIWVEIKHPASPAVLVGYVYRNPAATHTWFDDFVQMMDKVCESNPNIVLLGDFNIDLLKPQPTWSSATSFVWFAPTNMLCDKNNSNLCYIARSYIYK